MTSKPSTAQQEQQAIRQFGEGNKSMARTRLTWPLLSAVFAFLLSFIGGAVGLAIGSASSEEYLIRESVQLDQILAFPSWEANSQTARFSQTLRRGDVQSLAAARVDLPDERFSQVSALTAEGSSVVEVSFVVADLLKNSAAIDELIDAALADLIRADRIVATQSIQANADRLEEVETELDQIFDSVGVAPGTNLGDMFNRSTFDLRSAEEQLSSTEDAYWLQRLPGDISAHRQQVDALSPVLDSWYALDNEHDELRERMRPAEVQLQELEIGEAILKSGAHHNEATISNVSRTTTIGRYIAGGAALGLALGLLLTAFIGIRRS